VKKIAVAVLAFALLMIFAKVESGNAVSILDQQQTSIYPDAVVGVGGESEQIIAQVVTAGMEGALTDVWLDLASLDKVTVEIQGVSLDSSPNDVVATSEVMHKGSLPTSCPNDPPLSAHIVFSNPVYFMAGEQFAIVIRSNGEGGAAISYDNNPYGGGAFFFDSRPNPPGEWVIDANRDLVFQTYMDPDPAIEPKLTYTYGIVGEGYDDTGITTIRRDTMMIVRDREGAICDYGKPWGPGEGLSDTDFALNIDQESGRYLTGSGRRRVVSTYTTGVTDTLISFEFKGLGLYQYLGPSFTAELPDYGEVTVTVGDWYFGILFEGTGVGRGSFDFGEVMTTESLVGVVVEIGDMAGLYIVTGESEVVAVTGL